MVQRLLNACKSGIQLEESFLEKQRNLCIESNLDVEKKKTLSRLPEELENTQEIPT